MSARVTVEVRLIDFADTDTENTYVESVARQLTEAAFKAGNVASVSAVIVQRPDAPKRPDYSPRDSGHISPV